MSEHIVLIACPPTGDRAETLQTALRLFEAVRDEGKVPHVPYLDRFGGISPEDIPLIRKVELESIRRRFVDEVRIIDHDAAEMQEVVAAAIRYGYWPKQ